MHCFCLKSFIKMQLKAKDIKFTDFKKTTDKDGKSLYKTDGSLVDPNKKPEPDTTLYCEEWFINYALQ